MPINNSRFDTAAEMDFIRRHGEWVNYFIGLKCTNVLIQTGSNLADANRANPSCPACHGLGWVWQEQPQIFGLVSGITQHKDLMMAGILAPGDLVFSPDLRYILSDYDKIQLSWPQGVPYEGELIFRGSGATDATMYGILEVVKDGCISVNPTTAVITNYILGTDFTVSGQTVTWLGVNQPAAGAVYSLKYKALIDWIVLVPPEPRRERDTNLGQRVILRKKHVVAFGV